MHTEILVFVVAIIAFTSAVPLTMYEVEPDQQFELASELSRQRRQAPQRWFGSGGGNSQSQNINLGLRNPNGSGGQLGYGHARGYGHDVSVDAMVPVWSRKTKGSESTLNLGGGVSQHFGGPSGTHMTDKRVGLTFIHRF